MALPPTLDELVAKNHPVRVVNEVLDKVDITRLIEQYKPEGTSSYHPCILLKVMVYAYINNIYSSRRIEEVLQENIYYMLRGMSKPDHNTINRFRGKWLQATLQPIFTQVVLLLFEEGLLSIKDIYTDGTKIEANAKFLKIYGENLVSAGDVIRIGNTCSIGVYQIKKDSMYGYDYHKINCLSANDVIKYGKLYILSTSNKYGGVPKLYFYDASKNTMVDSLNLNFPSYGQLFLNSDELIGIAPKFLYKVNLKTRKVIWKDSLSQQVNFAMQLSDGRIAINTQATLPKAFTNFFVIPYSQCYESNNSLYAS